MVAPTDTFPASIVDEDSVVALREIIGDPALPVATTVAGAGGARAAVLREALDHLTTVRATAATTADHGDQLLAELADIDADLADVLRWHVALTPIVAAAEPGRARNGLLGDISRGDVVTWADVPRSWTWEKGTAPVADLPLGRVTAEVEIDDFPGLYDAVLVWEQSARVLVVVPTHRDRVTWAPAGPADATGRSRWVVGLDRVTFHADDLLPLEVHPSEQSIWREPRRGASQGHR